MKKRNLTWMLMAALVLGLSMGITSCKDDDDNSSSSEQEEQEEAELASMKFWDVVGQLAGTSAYTQDYKDKTFEPLIGLPDETDPLTRIVATNDMASAAQNFADLVNEDIDLSESMHEWSDPDVGTLIYYKTDDGKSWAEVEVNIPQMPALKKIIYRSPEQSGDNAINQNSTCCYRFGDIVKRVYTDEEDGNKQKTEYWVCVRPAFGPEGKGNSHWISLSPLPKKYIWEKEDSKNRVHRLPTGIGVDDKHMQNLAEMLYAMFNGETWKENVLAYPAPTLITSGLRMFYDFSHDPDKVTYHSPLFWQRVTDAWKRNKENGKDMFQLIFGKEYEEVRKFTEGDGLHLLAHGYSWKTTISWNMSLFEYKYTSGERFKSNMHNVTERKVTQNMKNFEDYIDVSTQYTADKPYLENSSFFGDDQPRYIIRHATGKELAGYQPDVYFNLGIEANGISNVYTYNDSYRQKFGLFCSLETEEDIKRKPRVVPAVGFYVGDNGYFYTTRDDCIANLRNPLAIVVYCGDTYRVESGTEYNGLAMALENSIDVLSNDNYIFSTKSENITGFYTNDYMVAAKDFNGLKYTRIMNKETRKDYPAATAIYYNEEKLDLLSGNFSYWFIPSAGQWCLAMEGLGLGKFGVVGQNEQGEDIYGFPCDHPNENLISVLKLNSSESFFTSTESKYKDSFDNVWGFAVDSNPENNKLLKWIEKGRSFFRTRKFIAFKYSTGGKRDIE
jgi:hypothetical protein